MAERLVVTGSRYGHPEVEGVLSEWVSEHGRPELLILGDARGVDTQAHRWAVRSGLAEVTYQYLAEWKMYGLAAGPMRNGRMVTEAGPGAHLIAFPCARSTGTWDCIRQGRAGGLKVRIVGDANIGE